jgi:hypothetical protein
VAQTAMNGQPCDDLDGCTLGETCNNQQCTGGSLINTCSLTSDGCCPGNCDEINDIDCQDPCLPGLSADNGTATQTIYCYLQSDTVQQRAQKACEATHGVGNCCIITGGYNSQQYGLCGQSGAAAGSLHWHYDNHPSGHCAPNYVIGDVVGNPGWCGSIIGTFL